MKEYNLTDLDRNLDKLMLAYKDLQEKGLYLNLSRGKPATEQVDLSNKMFDILTSTSDFDTLNGVDCRNYGMLDGIPRVKNFFSELLGVNTENIFVGGNSSLNMMYDMISQFVTHGIGGQEPWCKQKVKFLCPVPGYDRHFAITEYFGIEMINVELKDDGPDMDIIEKLVSEDEYIKGIWCVPKYSNPTGTTYSDDVVRRFARLKPKAKDFRIMWDNAYCIHDLYDTPDTLLNIMDECKKTGNEDLPIIFCSTSKITFPGSGVAAMAASDKNIAEIKKRYSYQTIGYDKLNQLKHILFFKDMDNVKAHMKKHSDIVRPKFDIVLNSFDKEFKNDDDISWTKPNGGYFITLYLPSNCAKRTVELCKNAGLIMTPAGATHPYGKDPLDSVLRIAPTFSPLADMQTAVDLLCLCVKIAKIEKQIREAS